MQRGIAQRGCIERKRPAMGALYASLLVEMFQIFADGDERRGKAARQVRDDHAAIPLDEVEDFAAALFAQHAEPGLAGQGFDSFLFVIIFSEL